MKHLRYKPKGLSDKAFAYVLLAPALAAFLIVIVYPFINSLLMSFTNMSMLSKDTEYVGLSNFERIFGDPNFIGVFTNTLVFVIGSVYCR